MNIALRTCNKLKTFWYKTDCTHKWKLQVYNAVIIAQISYGMNTVQLTQAMLNRLDAFQMRGLRYILKIEHAYYSGVSNQEVYDKINIVLNKGTDINITWQEFIAANKFDKPKNIQKSSEYIMNQQNRTFAHVVRADQQDPMKQMTMTENLEIPGVHLKRVGRPRITWIHANSKWIYEKAHPDDIYDPDKAEHKDWLKAKCEAGW
jgi:hypothetical protein